MAGDMSARMREEIGVVLSTQARGTPTEIVSMDEHYGRWTASHYFTKVDLSVIGTYNPVCNFISSHLV